jgi:hypothetical protein
LRTPLTLLRGYGQMLGDEAAVKGSGPLTIMVNGILAGADRLHAIVDSMLDVAKIDHRVLELNYTSFSLQALLRLVCEDSGSPGQATERRTGAAGHLLLRENQIRAQDVHRAGGKRSGVHPAEQITVSGGAANRCRVEGDSVRSVSITGIDRTPDSGVDTVLPPPGSHLFVQQGVFMAGPGWVYRLQGNCGSARGIIWAESPVHEKLCRISRRFYPVPTHRMRTSP